MVIPTLEADIPDPVPDPEPEEEWLPMNINELEPGDERPDDDQLEPLDTRDVLGGTYRVRVDVWVVIVLRIVPQLMAAIKQTRIVSLNISLLMASDNICD